LLKWGLALCTSVLLLFGWGSHDFFYYCTFICFVPLLVAEHFLTKRVEIKYAIGAFSIVLFQLLAGRNLIDEEERAVIILLLINGLIYSIPWAVYIILKRHRALPVSLAILLLCWLSIEQLAVEVGTPSPWFQLGNGLSGRPDYLQFIEYTGVSGGSLWILVSNAAFFLSISYMRQLIKVGHQIIAILLPTSVIIIPIIVSRGISFEGSAAPEEVLIVHTQQTDSQLIKPTFFEMFAMSKRNVTTNTMFLIWPESIFEFTLPHNGLNNSPLITAMRKHLIKNANMKFLLGLLLESKGQVYNTGVILASDSIYIYEKRRIAPFSEYQPSLLRTIDFLDWSDRDISPGRDTFPQSGRVSASICYETLFGHLVAENTAKSQGQLIALISNEFWTTGASVFLLRIAALRAIENRKYVLRSTNNGISAVIAPNGSIVKASTGRSSIEILRSEIICNTRQTFYMRHGDLIGRSAMSTITAVLLIVALQACLTKSR
jgi:apolipoprotein N-acyltransferase